MYVGSMLEMGFGLRGLRIVWDISLIVGIVVKVRI